MSDRELAERAQRGDAAAANILAERYLGLAKHLAGRYFYPGAEYEDVVQEALAGLVTGIRTWDPDQGSAIRPFFALCMERSILTGLKFSRRRKHQLLNGACSLDERLQTEDGTISRLEVLAGGDADPALRFTHQERLRELLRIVNDELSPRERHALVGFLNMKHYRELGEYKTIDNALQRARRKLLEAA